MSGERPQFSMNHQWPNRSSHPPQNAMGASHQNAVHSSLQSQPLNDPNFNLESFLAADLSSMYAEQSQAYQQQPSSSSFPPVSNPHPGMLIHQPQLPMHYHSPYDARPLGSNAVMQPQFQTEYPQVAYYHEQQRPHSHSIATTSSFIPQPSRPLSAGYRYSPPPRWSCRFQRAASGGEGERSLQVGSSGNRQQHQYEQFISQPQLLHSSSHLYHQQTTSQTDLQTSHQASHQVTHLHVHHDPATAAPLAHQRSSCCPLHSGGTAHQVHCQHQQPLSGQQLQALPHHHYLQQQSLLPQHQSLEPQPALQQSPAQQQIHQKSLYVAFPPLIQQLEKTATHQSTQTNLSAATPIAPPPPLPVPPPHPGPSLPPSAPASLTPVPPSSLPSSAPASLTPVPPLPPPSLPPSLPPSAPASFTPVPPPTLPPPSPTTHFPFPSLPPPHPSPTLPSAPVLPQSSLATPPYTPNPHSPLIPTLPSTSYHSANSPDSPERPSCRNIDFEGIKRMRLFARRFKELRQRYEYSQADVAQQVLLRYSFETCEGRISLFETSSLAFEEMASMKTHLEKWILEVARSRESNEEEVKDISYWLSSFNRPRRKRTAISVQTKKALMKEFESNPKPPTKDLRAIAERLHIKFNVVRVWFCNRRQMKKSGKINDNEDEEEDIVEEEAEDEYSGSSQGESSKSDTQPSQ